MTNESVTPNTDGWLADLRCQEKQASRAILLLEHAVETLQGSSEPNEERMAKAQRFRGAAVVTLSAALELLVTCGWLEGAHAGEMHGLISEDGDGDDPDAR
jgi:hypothetical protein